MAKKKTPNENSARKADPNVMGLRAEVMWLTTMSPDTRRLIKVMPEDIKRTAQMFDLLPGDACRLSKGAGPDYTDLSAVYGILSLYPEQLSYVTEELLRVFQTASQEGLDGPNWPLRVNELRNALEYTP